MLGLKPGNKMGFKRIFKNSEFGYSSKGSVLSQLLLRSWYLQEELISWPEALSRRLQGNSCHVDVGSVGACCRTHSLCKTFLSWNGSGNPPIHSLFHRYSMYQTNSNGWGWTIQVPGFKTTKMAFVLLTTPWINTFLLQNNNSQSSSSGLTQLNTILDVFCWY